MHVHWCSHSARIAAGRYPPAVYTSTAPFGASVVRVTALPSLPTPGGFAVSTPAVVQFIVPCRFAPEGWKIWMSPVISWTNRYGFPAAVYAAAGWPTAPVGQADCQPSP